MLSDYEKNYLETNTNPNPINITKDMSTTEQNLEILRYIKGAIRNQPIYYRKDIERCDAFLDSLVKENEINLEWERYEKEKALSERYNKALSNLYTEMFHQANPLTLIETDHHLKRSAQK